MPNDVTAPDEATIARRLAEGGSAGKRPLIAGPAAVTFAAAADQAARYRTALGAVGVQAGSRVAVAVSDDDLLAPVLVALWQAGACAVMVPVTAPRAEAERVLDAARPVAAVVDGALSEAWALHTSDLAVLTVARPAKRGLIGRLLPGKAKAAAASSSFPAALSQHAPATEPPAAVPADAPALVLSTSGSTGQPSIIPITRRNLAAQSETMGRHLSIGEGDAVLNVSPMNHVDGVTGLFMAWWTRSTLVRVPFAIHALHDYTDAIWRHDVTHAVVVPTVLSLLVRLAEDVREAFASERFRLVVCTAAPLTEAVWQSFEQATGRPVVNMYGLTECGNVLFAGPDEATRVPGTVGKAVDCRVRLADDTGTAVPAGHDGEVWVSGPSVAPRAPGVVQHDGETWFPTGDLARLGDDGLIRIVGRRKNVIITGGRNIYPQEVDAAVLGHAGVLEAATVGMPDPVWGEQAVTVVSVKPGAADEAELAEHAAAHLADWKVPRQIHVWAELPKGKTGKVDRAAVRARLADATAPADGGARVDFDAVESRVLALAAQAFRVPRDSVTPAARAGQLRGWDSLAHLTFVVALERAFEISLTPNEVVAIEMLAQAVAVVTSKLEERS